VSRRDTSKMQKPRKISISALFAGTLEEDLRKKGREPLRVLRPRDFESCREDHVSRFTIRVGTLASFQYCIYNAP
jgi:hypothetical protein